MRSLSVSVILCMIKGDGAMVRECHGTSQRRLTCSMSVWGRCRYNLCIRDWVGGERRALGERHFFLSC